MSCQEDNARARVLISGRVQGVWFRGTARSVAESLGLKGWVRNLRDGSVEAVFEGPRSQVQKAISWCRQGPPLAHVASVVVNWEEPAGQLRDFSIRF